jgi:hypothetical protein
MTNLEQELEQEGFIEIPNTRCGRFRIYAHQNIRKLVYTEDNGELHLNTTYQFERTPQRQRYREESRQEARQ